MPWALTGSPLSGLTAAAAQTCPLLRASLTIVTRIIGALPPTLEQKRQKITLAGGGNRA